MKDKKAREEIILLETRLFGLGNRKCLNVPGYNNKWEERNQNIPVLYRMANDISYLTTHVRDLLIKVDDLEEKLQKKKRKTKPKKRKKKR